MEKSINFTRKSLLNGATRIILLIQKQFPLFLVLLFAVAEAGKAQNTTSINNINSGMPNRISMNVTVARQTQGATFGEKVNQGLHAAGGALAQGASLLGSAIPGGSILSAALSVAGSGQPVWETKSQGNDFSLPGDLKAGVYQLTIVVATGTATNDTLTTRIGLGILTGEKGGTYAVSSVGNLAGGAGGGAAAASYAKTGKSVDVNYYTIYINGVEYALVKSKSSHDTIKNSIGNVR